MFKLEEQIATWRQQIEGDKGLSSDVLDELEDHLRAMVENLENSDLSVDEQFTLAAYRTGHPFELQSEFHKLTTNVNWLKRIGLMLAGYLLIDTILNLIMISAQTSANVTMFYQPSGTVGFVAYAVCYTLMLAGFFYALWSLPRITASSWIQNRERQLWQFALRHRKGTIVVAAIFLVLQVLIHRAGMTMVTSSLIPVAELGNFFLKSSIYGITVSATIPVVLIVLMIKLLRPATEKTFQTIP